MSAPNGCGAEGSPLDPPELRFHNSCNEHDSTYDLGGTERDRFRDDEKFLDHMMGDTGKAPLLFRPFYGAAALIYFGAVRAMGWRFFNYRKS